MTDIRQWLEELGLAEYSDAFEGEKIDLEALPHITGDDLKDMGLPIGPRRKLLAAIANLTLDDDGRSQSRHRAL